jgi:uncharacterized membrane protein YphA (DoxX/SURF4 family)
MAGDRFKSLYIFLRMVLGLVFVWAASSKIMDPNGFAAIIQNYMILPDYLINTVAVVLPWLEALCGILLITGYLVHGSAFIVNMLLIVFIFALSLNIFRGVDINCGCFSLGTNSRTDMYSSLLRDLPLLALGIWVFLTAPNPAIRPDYEKR